MNKKLFVLGFVAIGLLGFRYNDNLQAMGLKFVAPSVNNKANVFQPEAGEIIYDASVSKFYGQDHSNNWVALSAGESILPAGVILPYGGANPPNGFLFADGSELTEAQYPELFAAIGRAFGGSIVNATFRLPDMRGRFMRGVDVNGVNDPEVAGRQASASGGNSGGAVGSVQGDSIKAHSHTVAYGDTGGYAGPNLQGRGSGASAHVTSSVGGAETRPKNIYVNYIIKF